VSKWKYVRKRKLSWFKTTKHAEGFLYEGLVMTLISADPVPAAVFLILSLWIYSWGHGRFDKIETAIKDHTEQSGGGT